MPGIGSMLNIAGGSLLASTSALDTISHNVANINTPGYTRQETVLTTNDPEYYGNSWYGNGVNVASVVQDVDKQLESQITTNTSQGGLYDNRLSALQNLQDLDNESSSSNVGSALTAFFNSWQQLSQDPSNTADRQALVQSGQQLASRLGTLSGDMEQDTQSLNGSLQSAVQNVNQICRTISSLNTQIVSEESTGATPNDLLDQRQTAINNLAQNMNIQWFQDANGSVSVYGGQGAVLVQGAHPSASDADPLAFKSVSGYSNAQVVSNSTGQVLDASQITSGQMGGWLSVRDGDLQNMQSFMDSLSKNVAWQVNYQSSQGVGQSALSDVTGTYKSINDSTPLNSASNTLPFGSQIQAGSFQMWVYQAGTSRSYTVNVDPSDNLNTVVRKINAVINPTADATQNPVASVVGGQQLRFNASNGITFAFGSDTSGLLAAMGVNTFFSGSTAGDIAVNGAVSANVANIAAGQVDSSGNINTGDNSNALSIANLANADTMSNGTQTFNESVMSWSSDLGANIANAQDNQTYTGSASTQLQNLRDSVSGVNMDQELVNMIQYQRAYESSAKLISVADELLSSLINIQQ